MANAKAPGNEGGCKTGGPPTFGLNSTGAGGRRQLAAASAWRILAHEAASAPLLRESVASADLEAQRQQLELTLPGAGEATALAPHIGNAVIAHNRVDDVTGDAEKDIKVGDDVFRDETVRTGEDSNGKFLFSDQTNLALGPKSTVKLDRFVFSGEKTYSTAVLSLTKGTFRFITGNSPKTAYEIDTPVASIGVRGTIVDIRVRKGVTTVALQEGKARVCLRNNRSRCEMLLPGQTVIVTLTKAAFTRSDWTFASTCVADSGLCGQTTLAEAEAAGALRLAQGLPGGETPCAP